MRRIVAQFVAYVGKKKIENKVMVLQRLNGWDVKYVVCGCINRVPNRTVTMISTFAVLVSKVIHSKQWKLKA